ncbi:MAG: hypothetical protein NVS2B14_13250 [Chamaesiphon sp.]
MDRSSVEANLLIEPPLPGKISWTGRRMIYTLINPVRYGTTYKVELQNAREGFTIQGKAGKPIQPLIKALN